MIHANVSHATFINEQSSTLSRACARAGSLSLYLPLFLAQVAIQTKENGGKFVKTKHADAPIVVKSLDAFFTTQKE